MMPNIRTLSVRSQGRFRRRPRAGDRSYTRLARHFPLCGDCQIISHATGRLCPEGQKLAFAPWRARL